MFWVGSETQMFFCPFSRHQHTNLTARRAPLVEKQG